MNSTVLITFMLSLFLFQNKKADPNLILWSKENIIRWSHYSYFPSKHSYRNRAETSLRIKIDFFVDGNMPNYRVYALFDKELSWTSDTSSSYLLEHERIHFDIDELYARKIRKGVLELRENNVGKVQAYNELIETILALNDRCQDNYDEETSHSLIISKQEEWEEKIHQELDSLSEYALPDE